MHSYGQGKGKLLNTNTFGLKFRRRFPKEKVYCEQIWIFYEKLPAFVGISMIIQYLFSTKKELAMKFVLFYKKCFLSSKFRRLRALLKKKKERPRHFKHYSRGLFPFSCWHPSSILPPRVSVLQLLDEAREPFWLINASSKQCRLME